MAIKYIGHGCESIVLYNNNMVLVLRHGCEVGCYSSSLNDRLIGKPSDNGSERCGFESRKNLEYDSN